MKYYVDWMLYFLFQTNFHDMYITQGLKINKVVHNHVNFVQNVKDSSDLPQFSCSLMPSNMNGHNRLNLQPKRTAWAIQLSVL